MELHETEDQQLEAVKKWFNENGRAILLGLIIGIGCVLGWNGWQNYKSTQAKEASDLFQELLKTTDKDNPDSFLKLCERIKSDYPDSIYASYAGFFQAKQQVEAGKFEAARKELESIVAESSDPSVKNIARLRLLKILITEGKAEEALASINTPGVSISGKFEAAYEEMKGDAQVALGREREARGAYQRAVELGRKSSLLDLKIEDLPAPSAPELKQ
ncbi:MAG: YfgM family protein [Methylococcales bacterium]